MKHTNLEGTIIHAIRDPQIRADTHYVRQEPYGLRYGTDIIAVDERRTPTKRP